MHSAKRVDWILAWGVACVLGTGCGGGSGNPAVSGPAPTAPTAPTILGPTEVQAGQGPYQASVSVASGLTVRWTVTGGTILSGADSGTVNFQAGTGPVLTLACELANSAGSATASRWLVALPFPPRDHLADLRAGLTRYGADIETEVASGDPAVYYSTSYYLHGLAAAAEASGDTAIMDTLVGYEEQMISLAKPLTRNGITYQEWGPWDVNGNPQQLDTFQGAAPLARTAAIIAGNPVFLARYPTQLADLTGFVDQSVFRYWFDKTSGIYSDPGSAWLGGDIPWLSTALGGWGSYVVWSDKCSHAGTMAAWMWQATGDPLYKEYATRIAQGFRSHTVTQAGCLLWDLGVVTGSYDPDNLDGSPDTSHANREPMMVATMEEAGIEFQLADIQAMALTLTTIIWNGDAANPEFANYIDGGNRAYGVHPPWENGNVYFGWNRLGKWDPMTAYAIALTDQLVQTQALSNPTLDTNGTSYGVIELAGTQALNGVR